MSCENCCHFAVYKVLCSCSDTERYNYYCGECFMQVFSRECKNCNIECNFCLVINEFGWKNAFKLCRNLKNVFPNFINQEIQPANSLIYENQSEITYSCDDNSSEESNIEIEKMLEVYLYFIGKTNNYYLYEERGEWMISKEKIQKFQFILKVDKNTNKVISNSVTIKSKGKFLKNQENIISLSEEIKDMKSFFYIFGFIDNKPQNIKYKNCFLYYDRGDLFCATDGDKKIFWID